VASALIRPVATPVPSPISDPMGRDGYAQRPSPKRRAGRPATGNAHPRRIRVEHRFTLPPAHTHTTGLLRSHSPLSELQ